MPFTRISLTRGKSPEYLQAVLDAVHQALAEGLGMNPEDRFQIIEQHEPGEIVFNRTFRGGPRSDDFIVIEITDGIDRGELAKRRFYKKLVELLAAGPGVRPEDVFVMTYLTDPVNFSFGNGIAGTETVATEALDRSRHP